MSKLKKIMLRLSFCCLWPVFVLAEEAAPGAVHKDLKSMSTGLQDQISSFAGLMITLSYVAGIGFTMASIFKFKQHKDNPSQVPIGTPFAMFAIGIILIFLPAVFAPAGYSIFGQKPSSSDVKPLTMSLEEQVPYY